MGRKCRYDRAHTRGYPKQRKGGDGGWETSDFFSKAVDRSPTRRHWLLQKRWTYFISNAFDTSELKVDPSPLDGPKGEIVRLT